jgi:hypothetical protein
VAAGILLTSGGDDDVATDTDATTATTRVFDGGMQAAVDELSGYVTRVRGLPFKQPVVAKLLDDEAFEKRLGEGHPVDQARIEGQIATLRALRLLPPDFDLEEEQDADLASVLGFYDPATDELFVRGRSASPYVRFVLVHELTHALQDQHFDLSRLLGVEDDVGLAYRSLVEGDAEDIGRDYISTLTPFEQDLIAREAKQRGDDLYGTNFYLSFVNFPYIAGKDFVRAIAGAAGNAPVDALYANPPSSTEQILDPDRYRAGDGPKPVSAPGGDNAVIDEGVIGQFELAFLLLQAMPFEEALFAIEGWGGSRYVTWRSGERTCTRIRFVGDTSRDNVELSGALRAWAGAHGSATPNGTTVTACS